MDKKRTSLDHMIEFFAATDSNGQGLRQGKSLQRMGRCSPGDGAISLEEIQMLLQDPVMSASRRVRRGAGAPMREFPKGGAHTQ